MSKRVVIVGSLLALSRAEAQRVITQAGDQLVDRVTPETSLVVLGGRGPHFQQSGQAIVQLSRARRFAQEGKSITVWTEDEWLDATGIATSGVRQHFTVAQLADTLKISRGEVERWLAAGLLHPAEGSHGVPLFDFRQAAVARMMAELSRQGVRLAKVKQAVDRLASWLPETQRSLADLTISSDARRLRVRTADGLWAEPSGQLLFDFDARHDSAILTLSNVDNEDEAELFRRAVALEELQPLEAAKLYRQFLDKHGPHPTVVFNLGNALYAADDVAAALQQYQAATELAPGHAGAWNNLANVLAELNQLEDAHLAYRRALSLDWNLKDARFNLAQTLEELGRHDEAVLHWRAYLAVDDESTWADYARDCLARS